eukprot:364199-Chlamydomonas_euryale.AAC.6
MSCNTKEYMPQMHLVLACTDLGAFSIVSLHCADHGLHLLAAILRFGLDMDDHLQVHITLTALNKGLQQCSCIHAACMHVSLRDPAACCGLAVEEHVRLR